MHWKKLIALLLAVGLMVSCFFPWVTIPVKNITVSGVAAAGTAFGKPGYLHLFLASVYILFIGLNRNWSKQAAFFLSAVNICWALRNILLIPACSMGICPVKHTALYLVIIFSIGMPVAALFVPAKKENKPVEQS